MSNITNTPTIYEATVHFDQEAFLKEDAEFLEFLRKELSFMGNQILNHRKEFRKEYTQSLSENLTTFGEVV